MLNKSFLNNMSVTVFSTTSSPFCVMLKDYLTAKGILFSEKMIDTDDEARREMVKASGGFLGVPFTVIVNGTGKTETIVGFDKGKLDKVFTE